ncbi:GIY-YIG nuclease family protein [bacterium]|nr:GIY-YIG nuclease family protein [bacterium]
MGRNPLRRLMMVYEKTEGKYYKNNPETMRSWNKTRMWVNGKYVSQSHPLHKPGRYKNFEAAAFSSLAKYESSVEGQVYVIVNPSFPEWVKVGMAIDSEDRLNNYQTSSPFRDYVLNYKWNVSDRRAAESEAHTELQKMYERRSEWFKCTPEQAQEVVSGIVGNYQ